MGSICLYVLIQKSGQKTAKSLLCALLRCSTRHNYVESFMKVYSYASIIHQAFYLKYAIFGSKTSSQVKTDPAILTGSRKRSWSQNLKSLAQKTKIWCNYVFSRRFGKYSFYHNSPKSSSTVLVFYHIWAGYCT